MRKCEVCGEMRSSVIACGNCTMVANGVKPRDPLPMSDEELRIAQGLLGSMTGVLRGRRKPRRVLDPKPKKG